MSVLERIVRGVRPETRSTLANPSSALSSALTGGDAFSGKAVNGETAMSVVPFFSATSLVAGAVGGVPLKVYKPDHTEARNSRQWRILHDQPNDEQTPDELWELVAHHLIVWGNAFLLKDRDEFGVVRALWPIAPSRMQVGRETVGRRATRYFLVDGGTARYYDDSILHIRGLSSDGLIGYSVIQLARQQLGNMLSQDEFSGRFWKNGTFMGAALMHPGQMSGDAQTNLEAQIKRKRGVAEANGLWVFEEDMKYQQLGMPLRDAEFVAQQKFGDLRIAQMVGLVPPSRWGVDDASLTYSNAETAGTEFVRWTGRKWWTRIQAALNTDAGMFPTRALSCEFVPADLMRADMKTRYESHEIGIRAGFLKKSEVRDIEGLPPEEGIDDPVEEPVSAPAAPARTIVMNMPPDEQRSAQALERTASAFEQLALLTDRIVDVEEREQPAPPATIVNVASPPPVVVPAPEVVVNVPPGNTPDVVVNVPEQRGPDVNVDVHPTPVTVEAPVTVNVPPPGERKVTFDRDFNGNIKSAQVEDQ